MLRRAILMVALTALAGCAADNNNGGGAAARDTNAKPTAPELAAYAGHAQYPTTQPASDGLRAAAIVSGDRSTLKIYNFSGEPIRNADVWVNGAFVQRVNGVAPQSSVVIRTNQLYNGLGKNFASQGEPVSRVQIESNGTLYNLMGPATE